MAIDCLVSCFQIQLVNISLLWHRTDLRKFGLAWARTGRSGKRIAFIRPFDAQSVPKWNFDASETQISTGIHLKAKGKYYIKIMYALGAHGKSENFLQVAWKQPQQSNFKTIGSEYLLVYTNDSEKGRYKIFDD